MDAKAANLRRSETVYLPINKPEGQGSLFVLGILLNKANQHISCSFVRVWSRALYYRDNSAAWLASGVAVELGNLTVEIWVKVPYRQHPDSRKGLVAVLVASKSLVASGLATILNKF